MILMEHNVKHDRCVKNILKRKKKEKKKIE